MDKCLCEMQQTGSNKAFEQLYNESKKGVFSFIYSYVPNYHDAEDLMQMTYINVRKYVNKYMPGTNAVAWVLEIAKNNCLNFIKKKNSEVVFSDAEVQISRLKVEAPEVGGQIFEIIKKSLDDVSRQIVVMHLVTGLKHREIAKQLQIPLGTVLWKYNKAVKTLKEQIKKDYYED